MKVTALAPLIAIGVGVWGIVNAIFPFVAVINERRDTVFTGCLAGVPITHDHRRLILRDDYMVMTSSMVLLLIGIGAFVLFLPSLITSIKGDNPTESIEVSSKAKAVMYCIGIGLISSALIWGGNGYYEYGKMWEVMANNVPTPICKSEVVGQSKTRPL